MPPVEIESIIPREVVTEVTDNIKNDYQIVNKALELPLVSDAVTLTKSTLTPLVVGLEGYMSPVIDTYVTPRVINLKNQAEAALPVNITESLKANAAIMVEQAKVAASGLDKLACGGLDQLTEKVPLLKESTPDVLENTRETAVNYFGIVSEYVASFTVAQVVLKLSDVGLSTLNSVLQKTGLEESIPLGETINKLRRGARAVRRAGARRAGTTKPASTIGEASFLGALAEIFGLNFLLSIIGLQLVPRYKKSGKKVATFDVVTEESADAQLNAENLADYDSDKDPDYAPSEASDDSLEYNSDAEQDVVYEDEHAKVIAEPETELEPIVVDTEVGESVSAEAASEHVEIVDIEEEDENDEVTDEVTCLTPKCERVEHKGMRENEELSDEE